MNKEVNILSRDYYPDNSAVARLLTELSEDLSKEFKINVFAGHPFYYYNGKLKNIENNKIKVKRAWCPNLHKDNLFKRTINELFLSLNVFSRLCFSKNKLNIVTSLPFPLQLTALLLNKIRKHKYILITYETMPELMAATHLMDKKSLRYKILHYLSKKVIDNSSLTVSIGSCMTELLKNKTKYPEKIRFIPNWADIERVVPIPKEENYFLLRKHIADKFIISFSGNLGRYVDVNSVLKVAKELRKDKEIAFVFIGNGKKQTKVFDFKKKCALENIHIFDYLPREEVNYSLNSGDVALVLMDKGTKGVLVPSKVYELMAAARSLIVITEKDTELEKIVNNAKNGFVIRPGDSKSLKKAIVELKTNRKLHEQMGRNSRNYVVKNFSRKNITEKYAKIIKEIA